MFFFLQKKDKAESSKKRKSRGKAKPVISDEDDETDEVWNKRYRYVNSELTQYCLIYMSFNKTCITFKDWNCRLDYKTHVYERKKA